MKLRESQFGLQSELLYEDARSGDQLFGQGLLSAYDRKRNFIGHPDLQWFRDAVQDVRECLAIPDATIAISSIKVYKQLYLARRGSHSSMVQQRRGTVVFGPTSTLFMTPEGLASPRVRFEEVAHALLRRTPIDESDALLDEQHVRYIEAIGSAFGGRTPEALWLPIRCHLDILQGFLKSKFYRASPAADQQFAEMVVQRLRDRCRKCRRDSPDGCPC